MTSPTLTEFLSYLDGELPFARKRAFEAYLRENLEAARRLRQIERLEDRLVENLMVSLLIVGQGRGSPDGDEDGDEDGDWGSDRDTDALATPAAPAPLSVVRDEPSSANDREEAVAHELAQLRTPPDPIQRPTEFPPLRAVHGEPDADESSSLPDDDDPRVHQHRITLSRPSPLTRIRQGFARMSGWLYRALIPTPRESGHIAALSDTSLGIKADPALGGVNAEVESPAAKETINAITGARVDTNVNLRIEKPPPAPPAHRHASPIATARNPAAAAARELVGHPRNPVNLPARVRDIAASVCDLPTEVQAAWIDGVLTPEETRQIIRALSANGLHSTDLVRLVTTVASATRVEYPPLPPHIQVLPTSEPTVRRQTTSSYLVIDESLFDDDN